MHLKRSARVILLTVSCLVMACTLACAWLGSIVNPTQTSIPTSQPVVGDNESLPGDSSSMSGDNVFSEDELRFEHISLPEGLSQSSVFAIYQDSIGYLWFGTQDGLNKYDGYDITIYRPSAGDVNSLSAGDISAIFEDQAGNLWVGTNGWGLNRFDRDSDQFTQYRYNPQNRASLGGNIVNVIFQDSSGQLWIGTDGGLNKYNPGSDNFLRYRYIPSDPASLSSNTVLSILEGESGWLWIGTAGGGLNKFDPQTSHFYRYKKVPGDPTSLSSDTVWSLSKDQDGNLWIGTEDGLNSYSESTGRFIRYQYSAHDPNSLSGNQVRAVYVDHRGMVWAGTNGAGLNMFDRGSGRFLRLQPTPNDPDSLNDDFIWEIYEDREGTLWVGTLSGGVNKLDRSSQPFKHYSAQTKYGGGLSDNMVWSIFEDKYGILWIGTMGGGLNKFDPATGVWVSYVHDPNDPTSLSHNNVRTINEDDLGYLWVGTEGGGLNRFDRQREEFIHFEHDPINPNSLSSNAVLIIYKDRFGNMWVGTLDGGLNRFDNASSHFIHYNIQSGEQAGLSSNTVRSLYMDREGILWVGTVVGLDKLNWNKGIIEHYTADPDSSDRLSPIVVLSIYEDRKGILWLGTFSGGLVKYDRETESFTGYTQSDGLANDVVYGILEDEAGYLWLSTNNGISRFNPETEIFENYDVNDGLQSNEFNAGAYHKGKKGLMYFGGVNGFNSFNPEAIREDNLYIPPVVLTSLTQGGETVYSNESLDGLQQISFRWPDDYFEFEFAALSFVEPEQNQYAYMLEGFDKDWIYVGNNRSGRYTNLPGGSYTLKIKGTNNDEVWNETALSLGVTIVPPIWETWWFRGLVLLLLVVGVVSGYRLRVGSIEARSRELEQQVQERTFEVERRRQVAEGLRDILVILNSDKSIRESLNSIVCQAAQLTGASGAFIFHRAESKPTSIMASCFNGPEGNSMQEESLLATVKWISSRLLADKHLILTGKDITQNSVLHSSSPLIEWFQSLLGIPLQVNGRPYGGLILLFEAERSFTDEDLELGFTFAEHASLAIANAQLRDRAEQAAVSAERNRLARDLHDSAKQQAFAVSAQLGAALALIDNDHQNAKQHLEEADRLAYEVRQELTDLIQELHPIGLDGRTLDNAIRDYALDWGNQYDLSVHLNLDDYRPLSDEIERALFRILQGALSNISRHSQATSVEIDLIFVQDYVKLSIKDNGRGFDINTSRSGLGLRSMRERVELLKGEFSIETQIGKGTLILVKFFG